MPGYDVFSMVRGAGLGWRTCCAEGAELTACKRKQMAAKRIANHELDQGAAEFVAKNAHA